MCGRFSQFSDVETIADRYDAHTDIVTLTPQYNLAPGMDAAIVVGGEIRRRLICMRWGLIPSWAKDSAIAYRLINARGETAAEKPSFRGALKHRRCLVPADGFFEWSGPKGRRQPWFFHAANGELLAFAGLWEQWQPPDGGSALQTFAILTTAAAGSIAEIHDRMPVIVGAAAHAAWLGAGPMTSGDLDDLIAAHHDAALSRYRVSTVVNTARNNTAACIAPAPEPSELGGMNTP